MTLPERVRAMNVALTDGEQIYAISDAKVGIFKGIAYENYPFKSENAIGGVMGS